MAKPKLALIPAAQGDKFYSVLPSDGVGDFTFARASTGTRIAPTGLIEEVASGDSRLNYDLLNGKVVNCPHYLLEPAKTNSQPYSEEFSNASWVKTNVTITSNNVISPDGSLNASKMEVTSSSGNIYDPLGGTGDYVFSLFVKYADIQYLRLRSTGSYAFFDIKNGRLGSTINVIDSKIEDYGNGWYRCSVVGNNTNSLIQIYLSETDNTVTGTGSAYIWGAQFEQGSYPTSYIPTNGQSGGVTRAAESADDSGDAATFNDSEGVLMAEISALSDDLTFRNITISDGSNSNIIQLRYRSTSNVLQALLYVGGVGETYGVTLNDITTFSKTALKYKENDVSFWVNGFEIVVDTSASTFPNNTLNTLRFERGDGAFDFYGKTREVQYFDSALTDAQLETLTSWTSLQEMITSQLYTNY